MQRCYTKLIPNIKGINIKKSYSLDNTYHIEVLRKDKRPINIKDYKKVHIEWMIRDIRIRLYNQDLI